ncbi:MAG: phosphonate ABC transporter, permease protein PhnE [Sphaerochaetaceae bacterium]|jgi:phosphonate transport system permease protein
MNPYDKLFPPKRITLSNGKTVEEKRSRTPLVLLILLIASIVSVRITGFNFSTIINRGNQFFVIFRKMAPPDTSYLPKIWQPLFDTIKMSLLGSFIGSLLAIPFAVIASSNIVRNRFVIAVVRLFLSIVRTLPTLVTALIATYIFGLGTLAGTTAITVFTFSYVGKILYEEIETADMGPYEAMEAMGFGKVNAFRYAVAPQILPSYLSNCLFCFEGNVRYAAILGYVGAGGLGLILNEKIGWREYDKVGMILIMLFFTVLIIESLSHYLRSKLT